MSPASATVIASKNTFSTGGGGGTGIVFDSGWSGSGTFTNGQDVTITRAAGGLGFVTDPRPRQWYPLETTYNYDGTYSRGTQSLTAQYNAAIQSSIMPAGAAGAIRQDFPTDPGVGVTPACFFDQEPIFNFSNNKCFVYVKRYQTWNQDATYNNKQFRVYGTADAGSLPDTYMGETAAFVEGVAFDNYPYFYTPVVINSQWTYDEHYFLNSSLGVADGLNDFYRSGLRSHAVGKVWCTQDATASGLMNRGYLNQISGTQPPTPIYCCNFYQDDKFAHVVVSAESSYQNTVLQSTGTPLQQREIQLPRAATGSDTSVGLRLRTGSLGTLSGKYLWVISENLTPFRVGLFS